MRAVADTGPLNYLVLIDQIALLPKLFESVSIPDAVRLELMHPAAPSAVRRWIATPPKWLIVERDPDGGEKDFAHLDPGEQAALEVARLRKPDLMLVDDRAAVIAARRRGLVVAGTIGLLDLGARQGLLDVNEAFRRLRATNFRCRQRLLDDLLAEHAQMQPQKK